MSLHIPAALRHRRFRLLWIGSLISFAGTRMQFFALLWHIRELTDQPIALGILGLVRFISIFVFSIYGGAIADTFNRRKILYITLSVQIAVAVSLSLLTFTDAIQLWHMYALSAIQAVALSFGLPANQSLTPNLVPRADLQNAFTMQSIARTTGSIIGPSLTGFVIAASWLGQPYTYLFNAISFVAILAAIYLIGPVAQDLDSSARNKGNQLQAMKEGVRFIVNQPVVLSSMLLDFIATFFSSANALMPIFAQDILGVGAVGYGWLSSAEGIGAAVAAVIISQMRAIRQQGLTMLWAVVIFGAATVAFGAATHFTLAMIALFVIGASDSLSAIIRNTIRQLQTPDRLRGRMSGISQLFFMGGPQLGEIEAATVAQFFGAPFAVISGGLLCIISVGLVAKRWPQLGQHQGYEQNIEPFPS